MTYFPNDVFPAKDDDLDQMKQLKVAFRTEFGSKIILRAEYKIGCLLNPDYRTLGFIPEFERDAVKIHLEDMLLEMYDPPTVSNQTIPKSTCWDKYKSVPPESGVETEMEMYFKTASLSAEENLLDWWRHHKKYFPTMAKLAQKLLAIPASNTSSEKVFSIAGHTIQKRRTCLSPIAIDNLLFLHSNL